MEGYLLTIEFNNGTTKEVRLSEVHRLTPDGLNPVALVYTDRDGLMHNIPFTSMKEFYFDPSEYAKHGKQKEDANGK